jgi:hypothetical protein
MNKAAARAAAKQRHLPDHDGTPARMVCTALALAVLVLVVRIAAVW